MSALIALPRNATWLKQALTIQRFSGAPADQDRDQTAYNALTSRNALLASSDGALTTIAGW